VIRRISRAVVVPARRLRYVRSLRTALASVNKELGILSGFDYAELRKSTTKFVTSLRVEDRGPAYRFSPSVAVPTLYASVFACLTLALHDEVDSLTHLEREQWLEYLDTYQDPIDGLWRDPVVAGADFENGHWWGSRHLVPLILLAYDALGGRSRHPLRFLEPFYVEGAVERWLESLDWGERVDFTSNEVHNFGSVL